MNKLYLEYYEELSALIPEEQESEEDFDKQTTFLPLHFYRKPFESGIEIDTETEVNTTALHLVIIYYDTVDLEGNQWNGRWFIENVYATRREACEKIKKIVDIRQYPFYNDSIVNIRFDIATLLVED